MATNQFFLKRSPNGRCGVVVLVLLFGVFAAQRTVSQTNEQSGINAAPSKAVASKRDPFWPVGYVPEHIRKAEQAKTKQEKEAVKGDGNWDLAGKLVVMNGVSSRADNEVYAVINNEIKSIGDSISVAYGGSTYTWVVDSITPSGKVKLRRLSVK